MPAIPFSWAHNGNRYDRVSLSLSLPDMALPSLCWHGIGKLQSKVALHEQMFYKTELLTEQMFCTEEMKKCCCCACCCWGSFWFRLGINCLNSRCLFWHAQLSASLAFLSQKQTNNCKVMFPVIISVLLADWKQLVCAWILININRRAIHQTKLISLFVCVQKISGLFKVATQFNWF